MDNTELLAISLLAVSKTWPASVVREAAVAGQQAFGENYVQEGAAKIAELGSLGLVWHFIGPLQSNKAKQVATAFDWVHSVDRLKIAERLSEQRPDSLAPLQVCLQVNVSGEKSKSGTLMDDLSSLAHRVALLPRLKLRGLMAIPAPVERLKESGLLLDTLSMGMSHDLEAAVAEGASIVRVGTAIFGARSKS